MQRGIFVLLGALVATLLSGCAGVSITPISRDVAVDAHKSGSTQKGYIVYEPMIVFEVAEREVCGGRSPDGKCENLETVCSVGDPKILPDYDKPFLINIKSGFGKAGAELQITDGWRLSGVKDYSDNTALLTTLAAVAGIAKQSIVGKSATGKCDKSGLYKWSPSEGKAMKLLDAF